MLTVLPQLAKALRVPPPAEVHPDQLDMLTEWSTP